MIFLQVKKVGLRNLKIISFENNNCNDKISKDYMKEIKKKVKITMNI